MKKNEVLRKLDAIREMTNEEIAINAEWIKEVALASYSLIKQKYDIRKEKSHE